MAVEITEHNYEDVVKKSDKLIVLDFYATWCGPCLALSPIMDTLSNEYDGKAVIAKVNVDENPDVNAEYGIRSIPTILFLKDGEIVHKFVGKKDISEFKSIIDSHL